MKIFSQLLIVILARFVLKLSVRKLGLERIVPKRRYHRGTEKGITGSEPLGPESDDAYLFEGDIIIPPNRGRADWHTPDWGLC